MRRLAADAGTALPTVVGVMLAMGILAAVVHQTAGQVRKSTTGERAEKRAFQAAEAGLNVARYRLNMASPVPDPTQCFTTVPVTTGGDCPQTSAAESTGGGASFRYTVTRVLTAGSTECDTSGLDFATNDYRCITAVGTSNGATRRVQTVVAAPKVGMFPVEGIYALGSLSIGPGNLNGQIGSNTSVSAAAGGPYGVTLGPGANYSGTRPVTQLTEPVAAPVNAAAFEATDGHQASNGDQPNENDNSNLPFGVNAFREVSITGAFGPVTVPPGTYNFCNLSFGDATRLRAAGPGPVRVFIDSPFRPGSGCRGGTGSLVANAAFEFTSTPPNPALVEVQVYGGPGTRVWMRNASTFHGTIYAPQSQYRVDNASTLVGGVVAGTVTISNFFNMTGNVPDSLTQTSAGYESDGWTECVRTGSSSSAAGAGC
jgi:Tfp pilus assembly protein PilX